MNKNNIFSVKKLETLSIDVKNKEFLINGETFGEKCKRISIECIPPKWTIKVVIDQPQEFVFDLNGKEL